MEGNSVMQVDSLSQKTISNCFHLDCSIQCNSCTHALVYEILFQQANMQEERKIQRKKKLFCMKFSILFFFTFKIFHFVFSVDSLVFLFAHSLFLFSFDFDVRLRTSVRSKYIFREEGSTDRYYIYRCICVCIV